VFSFGFGNHNKGKMKRKEIKKAIEWKRCTHDTLVHAVDFICPFEWHELQGKNRKSHLKNWRAAVMLAFYINGETMEESASKVNKHHATLVNQIKNVEAELFTCDYDVIDKIRLLNYYCQKVALVVCNHTQFNIQRA
jgi:hypothetical protein